MQKDILDSSLYAAIVINTPLNKVFHYLVPLAMHDKITIGKRVRVYFGKRKLIGFCVGFSNQIDYDITKVKPIVEIIDENPLLSSDMLAWTNWISNYYGCAWGQVLDSALPSAVKKRKRPLKKKLPPELSAEIVKEKNQNLILNLHQNTAVKSIISAVNQQKYKTFLLHGVTGSGKTEVYIKAIEEVVKIGKQAIVLVPEIALTPQTVKRFASRFENIAVMHSDLTTAQRANEWQQVYQNNADVIIGARSCIFAPTSRLGIIIIDEEHETSFKQDEAPRYHARDCAIKRAYQENAIVVLGSATPSLESFYNAQIGKYTLLELPERVSHRPLPKVNIIDMREQFKQFKRMTIISKPLEDAMHKVLMRNEQIILFLNRRGYATSANCPQCGYTAKCKACEVSLTYHKREDKLICHYCGFSIMAPNNCPDCFLPGIKFSGYGTQRVEEAVKMLFPDKTVTRIDSDITIKRNRCEEILNDFGSGNIDILIGTQMIAKGLDFANVTLVGVIAADGALHLPDFRASEKTFSLVSQVAGRAGRGEKGGSVIVQATLPDHYSIKCVATHDYISFAKNELETRKLFSYPPFSRLLRVVVRGPNEDKTRAFIKDIHNKINALDVVKRGVLLDFTPCPIAKLRTDFRFHFVFKSPGVSIIQQIINEYSDILKSKSDMYVAVDVDPISML